MPLTFILGEPGGYFLGIHDCRFFAPSVLEAEDNPVYQFNLFSLLLHGS